MPQIDGTITAFFHRIPASSRRNENSLPSSSKRRSVKQDPRQPPTKKAKLQRSTSPRESPRSRLRTASKSFGSTRTNFAASGTDDASVTPSPAVSDLPNSQSGSSLKRIRPLSPGKGGPECTPEPSSAEGSEVAVCCRPQGSLQTPPPTIRAKQRPTLSLSTGDHSIAPQALNPLVVDSQMRPLTPITLPRPVTTWNRLTGRVKSPTPTHRRSPVSGSPLDHTPIGLCSSTSRWGCVLPDSASESVVPSSQTQDLMNLSDAISPKSPEFKVPHFPPTRFTHHENDIPMEEVPSSQTQHIFMSPKRQCPPKFVWNPDGDLRHLSQDQEIVPSSQSQIERELDMEDSASQILPQVSRPNCEIITDFVRCKDSFDPTNQRASPARPPTRTDSFDCPTQNLDLSEMFSMDRLDSIELPPLLGQPNDSATESDTEDDSTFDQQVIPVPTKYVPCDPPSSQPASRGLTQEDLSTVDGPSQGQEASCSSLPDTVKDFRDMFVAGSGSLDELSLLLLH